MMAVNGIENPGEAPQATRMPTPWHRLGARQVQLLAFA